MGLKRTALESLLTYRTIRQLATNHLQQRTLLEAAQMNYTQMDGWQVEIHRATHDLWSQIPGWNTSLDPYAPDSAWVWEYITETEPQSDNRQAI
jgi:hypothetical protein